MTCRKRSLSQPILARCGWCMLRAASGWLRAFTCIQAAPQPQTTLVPIRPSAAFPWRPRIKSPVVVVTTTTTHTLSTTTRGHLTSPSVRVLLLLNGKSWKGLISPPIVHWFLFCLSVSTISAFVSLAWSGRDSLATPPPARGPSTDPNPYRYHHQLPPPVHAALLVNDLLELVVVGLVRLHVVECLS